MPIFTICRPPLYSHPVAATGPWSSKLTAHAQPGRCRNVNLCGGRIVLRAAIWTPLPLRRSAIAARAVLHVTVKGNVSPVIVVVTVYTGIIVAMEAYHPTIRLW